MCVYVQFECFPWKIICSNEPKEKKKKKDWKTGEGNSEVIMLLFYGKSVTTFLQVQWKCVIHRNVF